MTTGAPHPRDPRDPRDGGARRSGSPEVSPPMSLPARDALLDAYFDGEMDDASRAALLDTLRVDHGLASEFARMTFVVDSIARPVSSPDLTAKILGETARRTRGGAWTSGRARMWVSVGRLAAAACLLLVLGVVLIARRNAPERFIDRPTPLTAVVESGSVETADALRGVASALDVAKDTARRLGVEAASRPLITTHANDQGSSYAVAYPAAATDTADGPQYLAVGWMPDRPPVATSRALWRRTVPGELPVSGTTPPRDR